ncbi:alpha/beta hydrolase [Shewanella xiamenensis]|uniref:Alpha/beta hydrolase-fold protein n=1 Tax=Shewanella xiamenensis TaxID=332186 RepID=A0AAE4Q020_9GAMM|nr:MULTISPECIES: alpha/beta hydrolase-fold protein [Shewanella]MCT8857635.1 carboxylesterase [Shewanella xiamenensis]MDH1627307.1 alpha/beta hydrolase [Shewanella xiamenensis]MDN5498916.1 alpha/beta hydrolase [Shewanella sp.]MDN5526774.1 alpha/beta hydrolase [Shewanella sp.]MDV5248916.1 alpha/beta hydrolase-fold protein [Shewanella xiamenensis]
MTLERIVIEPQVEATAVVVWLHGLGDSGAGFAPVVPALGLPADHSIRFIFPHAPEQAVTINGGYIMRAWYDIKSMDLHDRADMQGVMASELSVQALIDEQIAAGIPSERIVLAGFSQGGVMSLFTGLRYPQKLAGIMALSCYLPTGDVLPSQRTVANADTPILQQHGEQDDVVPLSAGLLAKEALIAGGYPVQWQTYPMPHSVIPVQLKAISAWLQQRFEM